MTLDVRGALVSHVLYRISVRTAHGTQVEARVAACGGYMLVSDFTEGVHVVKPRLAATVSSGKMDWRTPEWILDIARLAAADGQLSLDPCTTHDNPTSAKRFYTPENDGLAQDWTTDGVLWCNPPYGRELKHWAAKWIEADAATKFFLCPARVDQPWFWELHNAATLFFLRKRVKFVGAECGAPFHSVVVVGGDVPYDVLRELDAVSVANIG